MARKEYKNLTVKMNPTIHKGLENWLKVINSGKRNKKKVYKVRVIEDLIFIALADLGFMGDADSDFFKNYISEMVEREYYYARRANFSNKSKLGKVCNSNEPLGWF